MRTARCMPSGSLIHLLDLSERQTMNQRTCSIAGCERAGKITRGWCSTHYRYWLRTGKLGVAGPKLVAYMGMHYRLRSMRGAASAYDCRHCGRLAAHWAYDHADPEELTAPEGWPFSLDPAHYMPLCASCHRAFDAAGRAA